jgi:hypothetical protein
MRGVLPSNACVSWVNDKNLWEWMALPAADARLINVTGAFAASGEHAYLGFHEKKRLVHPRRQRLVFTGIRLQDTGYRALLAQLGAPFKGSPLEQAAAFGLPAAMIIAIKITALFAGRGKHDRGL